MNQDQVYKAMESHQPVVAVAGFDRATPHAEGTIVAYCDAPSVCILTDAGERVWWRADLTEPVAPPPPVRPPPLPDPVVPDTWVIR